MSIVLPSNESNLKRVSSKRFAPSKSFQDAKEKLGPIYFSSKLVECPQNAIELSKLLQKYEQIDKKAFRSKEENRRQQRTLVHNLESRYSFTGRNSVQVQKVTDVKLPPAGFRYHADGTAKLHRVPIATSFEAGQAVSSDDSSSNLSDDFIGRKSLLWSLYTDGSDDNTSDGDETKQDRINEGKNLLKVSDKLISQIEEELKLNNADIRRRTGQKNLKVESKQLNVSFQTSPAKLSFGNINNKTSGFGLERKYSASKASCTSCQSKLKHNSEDFKTLQDRLSRKTSAPTIPWKIATQAKSLENRYYSLTSFKSPQPLRASSDNLFRKTSNSFKHLKHASEKSVLRKESDELSSSKRRPSSPKPKPSRKTYSAVPVKSVKSIPIVGRCSSADIIKQRQKEENADLEAKVGDFLKRLKSRTESSVPEVFF
ncbi:Hypothetical predicted protein [Mytilus galloprovincialis]|uniref:Uncharacterized protein n=1 Tax=Mytilus galloprovincialis TaxID=29158 RepID=A0A8B6EAY7_MYTGA|nr:Hypothetical predicted protein [Mytilus galloprovincialis]